jgi:hypothetical protein
VSGGVPLEVCLEGCATCTRDFLIGRNRWNRERDKTVEFVENPFIFLSFNFFYKIQIHIHDTSTLAKFVYENVSDIVMRYHHRFEKNSMDITFISCLGHLGQRDTNRNSPIHRHLSNIDCLSFVLCPLLAPLVIGFFSLFFFLLRMFAVIMKQTRQAVCAVKQSIFLRCLWSYLCWNHAGL